MSARLAAWGKRLKRAVFYDNGRYAPVDLFTVLPPASWGAIFAIRTGPGDFNHMLVTHAHGLNRKVAGGQVWQLKGPPRLVRELCVLPSTVFLRRAKELGFHTLSTHTEAQFFAALKVPCWPPREHRPPFPRY